MENRFKESTYEVNQIIDSVLVDEYICIYNNFVNGLTRDQIKILDNLLDMWLKLNVEIN